MLLIPDQLAPIHASLDRLVKITVCTRPFRAQGPRIEAERLGDKLVVHNYGHGGSGWSLSWGSGAVALDLALSGRDPGQTDIAVIGCGALGLTTALLAQRAGARSVTIYARDSPSASRSFRATGSWTPDSRVALASQAPAAFPAQWERMARASWLSFHSFLNLPGRPVEFNTRYTLSDAHPDVAEREKRAADPIGFALYRDRIRDLNPSFDDLPPGAHPFATQWARRHADLMFNITAYSHRLTEEFLANGGTIATREFHAPSEFATLPQPVILHCTGYGARSLFDDASLTPVRGQIAWLPPSLRPTTASTATTSSCSRAQTASSSSLTRRARHPAGTSMTSAPTAPKPKPPSTNSNPCTIASPSSLTKIVLPTISGVTARAL